MEQPENTDDKRHLSLLELPQDVLQAVCQQLFHASDLARLASCNRACREMVSRPALWEFLLVTRFGEDPIHISSLNSTALQALYVKKSRTTVPAVQIGAVHLGTRYLVHEDMINSTFGQILLLKDVCWLDINASFHGVLPGEYQIVWRMMKVSTRNVGWGNSPVTMSVETQTVHPTETSPPCEMDSTPSQMARSMQQFNHLPLHEWVDIPGGSIHIYDFSNVSVRLWCHSGDWKSGLAWDYVKLKDLNQPEAVDPRLQHARPLSDSVAASASSLVHRVQTAADDCTIQ